MLTPKEKSAFDEIVERNQLGKDSGIRAAERKHRRTKAPDAVVEHRHVLLSNRATIAMLIGAMVALFVWIAVMGGNA